MATTCKFCPLPLTSSEVEVCDACKAKLGLFSSEAVRPPIPCQRCQHPELIRAQAREFTTGNTELREALPMAVTIAAKPVVSLWTGAGQGPWADPTQFAGVLEMYVCRGCGFTEWYCRDPRSIPIGVEYGTELLDLGAKPPYR